MVSRLEQLAAWARAVFCGDVFVVVFTHEDMACAALNEVTVDVATCMGEMFVGF